MRRAILWSSYALFILSLIIGLDRLFHKSDFCHKLATPFCQEISALDNAEKKEIQKILSQPFFYLSQGTQCYVFVSQDNKYVLKFFKEKQLHPSTWTGYIPLSWNFYYQKHLFAKKVANEIYQSLKISFNELKNESALVYLHMEESLILPAKSLLFDKKGRQHKIDLNNKAFLVQKRADLIYPRISELMAQGDSQGAKKVISSVLTLLDTLGKKGIYDNDPVIRRNFGLVGDQAVQIDIGQVKRNPLRGQDLSYRQEILRVSESFQKWLGSNYPELEEYCKEAMAKF